MKRAFAETALAATPGGGPASKRARQQAAPTIENEHPAPTIENEVAPTAASDHQLENPLAHQLEAQKQLVVQLRAKIKKLEVYRAAFVVRARDADEEQQAEMLTDAARQGEIGKLRALVNECGVPVDATNDEYECGVFGQTALHVAASEGHVDGIRMLAEELGAKVDATNERGDTALHFAAEEGHVDVIRVLVELGAKVDATTNTGDTALHFAAWKGHVDAIRVLAELGAGADVADNDGWTALHWAAEYGQVAAVETLFRIFPPKKAIASAVAAARKRDGEFQPAVLGGEIASFLAPTLDPLAKTTEGKTALDLVNELHDEPTRAALKGILEREQARCDL